MVGKDPAYVAGRSLKWLKVKVPKYREQDRGVLQAVRESCHEYVDRDILVLSGLRTAAASLPSPVTSRAHNTNPCPGRPSSPARASRGEGPPTRPGPVVYTTVVYTGWWTGAQSASTSDTTCFLPVPPGPLGKPVPDSGAGRRSVGRRARREEDGWSWISVTATYWRVHPR